jgi:hypothetical protein
MPGEVPAARHEWHIDRVGPGWTGADGEVADFSDNARPADNEVAFGVVSYFWPEGSDDGPTSLATEFLLERLSVPLQGLVDDPRVVSRAISQHVDALKGPIRPVTYGSNILTWFGARTLHRPPVADRAGWRFFLRVGLHREPHSPYSDHRLACHRLWDTRAPRSVFRPVGTQETLGTWTGPLSRSL